MGLGSRAKNALRGSSAVEADRRRLFGRLGEIWAFSRLPEGRELNSQR